MCRWMARPGQPILMEESPFDAPRREALASA